MTSKQVKIKLIEKDLSVTKLAKRWDRPVGTVSMLINKRFVSRELEAKLARAIGVTIEELRAN